MMLAMIQPKTMATLPIIEKLPYWYASAVWPSNMMADIVDMTIDVATGRGLSWRPPIRYSVVVFLFLALHDW